MNHFEIEMAFEYSEQWKYSQICAAYCAAMSGMAKRLDELEKANADD